MALAKLEANEVGRAVSLLIDLRRQKADGIEVEVATHVAPDADAILATALSAIALGGARIVWQSSDEDVGPRHPNRMGVDVRAGPRSIKGRASSAAEVVACAMQRLGWQFDATAMEVVEEVTAIDSAKGGRRAAFNLGQQVLHLRAAGWNDRETVGYVAGKLRSHLTSPRMVVE